MGTLERAIELAVEHHKGQVDKAGEPYILHPLRLMMSVDKDDEKIVAVMHDIVEDTDITLDDLRKIKGTVDGNSGMIPVLRGIYHIRIEYPESDTSTDNI